MKVAVVGGGLAGLAAALELVDAGHTVTLLEARPTLGGAVQTLPEREGDPDPPPDNGCGPSLAWWLSPDAQATHARKTETEHAAAGPVLPAACSAMINPS